MPPIASEAFDIRLISACMLSESVRGLVFERCDGRPMEFLPGQWINLVLPLPSGEIKRAYSIASAPGGRCFELAVTLVRGGAGSAYLHAISESAVLRAIGPQGFFYRASDADEAAFMVATGTGVTPLRSMIQAALAAGSSNPLWLLFGARVQGDRLYLGEFERYQRQYNHFKYFVTLSRPIEGWTGKTGYVQEHLPALFSEFASNLKDKQTHLYVCGLERMVSAVRTIAKDILGLDRKRIHHERYD